MPRGRFGQLITISVELDLDANTPQYVWLTVNRSDTVAQIAARRGHPELARTIAQLNGIRSVYQPIVSQLFHLNPFQPYKIKVPGNVAQGQSINVLAQTGAPPVIKDGYATFDIVPVPGRKGLSRFTGYNPLGYDVPIAFENVVDGDGTQIEQDIQEIERLAGRGKFAGAAVGPPAVIRLSCTDNRGQQMHLIPFNYQWSRQNPTAPLWRINGIDWSTDAFRSDPQARRTRENATLHLVEYTPITLVTRSATARWQSVTAGQSDTQR